MSDSQMVRYEVVDAVAVITLDNPPVNALAPGMREDMMAALERGNADAGVKAFVLIGSGKNFIAGADVRQFGKVRPVSTRVSAAAIDASGKPVVAAIHGYALGAGLEHALACHYRVAASGAKLGLPEVNLGLIPGGGGTQRLTRLIGPEAALDLIATGRQLSAEQARKLGIVQEIVPEADLRAAAIRLAQAIADVRPLPRVRDRMEHLEAERGRTDLGERLAKVLGKKAQKLQAPRAAVMAVQAAVSGGFDDGIQVEQQLFESLESSYESKALRYAFSAERQAAKIPGAPIDYKPEPVRSAAVIGAGTMGGGIAICFAEVGIPVKVVEATQEALDRGMQRIRETYTSRVKRASISEAQMDEQLRLIQPVDGYEAIADCDVAIEAVFERIDLKKDVFSRLEAVMKPGALLLTNSSAIDINVMAGVTTRPGDVAGAHFFAPANVMKLCEIVRGDQSSMETIVRAAKMGRDLGKISVVAGTCDGFAANRSRAPLVTEAMLLLEEGALPQQIDKVMVDFGYPMGPFAVSDLSGLDVSYDTRKRRAAANPDFRKLHVPDRMVELGRKGQKTRAGWYRYDEGDRTPHPDPEVERILAEVGRELGTPQRTFTAEEILKRLLFASVNEACRILEDGKAYRGSDIDVMWLHGFGFPRHRGGPMYWADGIGAQEIHRQVSDWHEQYGGRWKPARLLADVAERGGLLRDASAKT
jgi:3-hydroxyacyl-CoA dehydrogenase